MPKIQGSERSPTLPTNIGLSCELKQSVAGHEIAFRYPYAEPSGEYSYGIEFDDDGNPTLVNPTPISQLFGQGMTRELDGPELVPHSLSFSVGFLSYLKTERDTATITVGERTWNLETLIFRLLRDGRELSSQATDLPLGQSAKQIFDAMLSRTDVTLRKRGQAAPAAGVAGTPAQLEGSGDLVVETRTTRFAAQAKIFQDCVDGMRRASRRTVR